MLPFVSICTPTFNRRPFIPYLVKAVERQIYDKTRIEWIIVDDGTDKIEDLVSNIPYVKYFKYEKQMTLGRKRNIMNAKCSGDIIVYMDDDDYYPPDRVKHAVESLNRYTNALCAGSSEMHIYFDHIQKVYQFGPYGPNHATAATLAFKKELLNITAFDDSLAVAEEKHFLKNYTIPMIQLDPLKTILVLSHVHNSVDKKKLLEIPNQYIKESHFHVQDFFNSTGANALKQFYVDQLNSILPSYLEGDNKYKPELIKQINILTEERKKNMQPLQDMHDKMMQMSAQYESILEKKEIFIQALVKQNKELKQKILDLQKEHCMRNNI